MAKSDSENPNTVGDSEFSELALKVETTPGGELKGENLVARNLSLGHSLKKLMEAPYFGITNSVDRRWFRVQCEQGGSKKGRLLDVKWNQICGGNLEQQTCFLRGEVFALLQARDFKYLGHEHLECGAKIGQEIGFQSVVMWTLYWAVVVKEALSWKMFSTS